MRRPSLAALAAALALAACSGPAVTYEPEVVTVELPAPPPTVVTETDTVYVDRPAPTVAEVRDSVGTPAGATPTAPETVTPADRLIPEDWAVPYFLGLTVDSADVELQLSTGDWSFLPPAKGERLSVYPHPDGDVAADLTGSPVPEPVRVTVPAPRVVEVKRYPTWRVMVVLALAVAALFPVSDLLRPLLRKG